MLEFPCIYKVLNICKTFHKYIFLSAFCTFLLLKNVSYILNAKSKAHNFRFDFCHTAALQIKFIYTREYTRHPATNTLNVLRVQISLKGNLKLSKNNEYYCERYLFCQGIPDCFLNEALIWQHSKSIWFVYVLVRGLKWQAFEVVQFWNYLPLN